MMESDLLSDFNTYAVSIRKLFPIFKN